MAWMIIIHHVSIQVGRGLGTLRPAVPGGRLAPNQGPVCARSWSEVARAERMTSFGFHAQMTHGLVGCPGDRPHYC